MREHSAAASTGAATPGGAASAASASSPAALAYGVAARTDKGLQRSANEDAVAVFEIAGVDLAFAVADGMGGLQAGDLASQECVRVVETALRESIPAPGATAATVPTDFTAILDAALRRANAAVFALTQRMRQEMASAASAAGDDEDAATQQRRSSRGGRSRDSETMNALMGTTCVAGVIQGGTLYLAHAGDSRAYLLRGGALNRLTEDHSFVAERVRAGDLTEAEARVSRFRNMITRAIGIDQEVQPDRRQDALRPGDTLIVCSDGLTTMLEDEEILGLLMSPRLAKATPDGVAEALIDAANRKGGHDNTTILAVRVTGAGGGGASIGETAPIPAATVTTATRPGTATGPANRPTGGGRVVDLDASTGRRKQRNGEGSASASPLTTVLAAVGAAALLVIGVLLFSPEVRQKAATALGGETPGGGQSSTSTGATTGAPSAIRPLRDYSKLSYAPPEDYCPILARGDLLTYSPRTGLYFVRDGTGGLFLIRKERDSADASSAVAATDGSPIVPMGRVTLEIAPSSPRNPPVTRVFTATDLQGNVYLSSSARKEVRKYAADGRLLQTLKGFQLPEAIAVDEQGNLYVIDYNNIRILRALEPKATAKPGSGKTESGGQGAQPPAGEPRRQP